MNAKTETLCQELLALPEEDRSYLAQRLMASFDDSEPLSPEWQSVIEGRLADIDSGEAQTIPAEQVHQRLRSMLGDAS